MKEKIIEIAQEYRKHLNEYLELDECPRNIIGKCRIASQELQKNLESEGFSAIAMCTYYLNVPCEFIPIAREEFGDDINEFIDNFDGSWKHWVVVCEEYIVDVTSDQFHLHDDLDCEQVVVTDIDDERYSLYKSVNCEQNTVFLMY